MTVLIAEDVSYLQLNTCKSGALHTSKRTAPQWQPPVCFTRPSRSLQTTDDLHQDSGDDNICLIGSWHVLNMYL